MSKNNIVKSSISKLGYDFISKEFLPQGKDEYYLRNLQNRSGIYYRQLTAYEIEVLVRNRNTSDDWNKIFVSDAFNAELVKNCKFFGLVRIGKLEPLCLEFSDLKVPVGLYNSTIISCDLGDNVVVDNVNHLSHYIIGNEVIIVNVNELVTSNHTKFGNGIIKEGEDESIRIWLEICNENGGRKVIPFNGMQPGDAWLWSKYRDDEILLHRFKELTEKEFKKERGYYGKIGNRTVIKNSAIIKDVWIGSDAYIKGANKLKNLTINSGEEGQTQIGEGCELVNGLIGFGCRIFYGVKAVRFIMASHSQLKYGARLINSYLGNNSTISCCEVLNSLIFPTHEQHHNNSFLCAALVMGQSNIPAGATIGSNHNSRGADGEIICGRGFWPGLCVSLKHNSKFAGFTILAKGDYSYELNIPLPFSLVSLDIAHDHLVVMPAYWFMYNMYALARNSWKYADRDKRKEIIQFLETDYLAPDSVNEMFAALDLLALFTGKAYYKKYEADKNYADAVYQDKGHQLLNEQNDITESLEIIAEGFEFSKRKTIIVKVKKAYTLYRNMIKFYGISQLLRWIEESSVESFEMLTETMPEQLQHNHWLNVGGQLMPEKTVEELKEKIRRKEIDSWEELHDFYKEKGNEYTQQKMLHGLASLAEIENISLKEITVSQLDEWLNFAIEIKQWIVNQIYASRAKDYSNPYRKMIYDTQEEMNKVLGALPDNSFIKDQESEFENFKKNIFLLKEKFQLAGAGKAY